MKNLTIPYIIAGALIYIQGIRVYFEGDFIAMIIYTSLAWILFLMAFYSYKNKKKPKQTDILGEPFLEGEMSHK
jgi:formate hydrogenlyase subunit 3/multisubunit Na+/H+ antiporter MnhD subunit